MSHPQPRLSPSLAALAALLLSLHPGRAQDAPAAAPVAAEAVDAAAVAFFREQGLEHSQVMDHLSWMCDVYGPRLTGSPNLRRAQEWAVGAFGSFGLENAHTEAWGPFGRGWTCDRALVEVIGDNGWPVLAYPKAWSSGLPGRVEAEVVYVAEMEAEQLEQLDLTGKVVFVDEPRATSEPYEGLGKRYDEGDLDAMAGDARPEERSADRRADAAARMNDFRRGFQRRRAIQRIVLQKAPLAVFDRASKGDYGTVFVQGATALPADGEGRGDPRAVGAHVVPQFTIAVEHYNRICRLLQKGQSVRLALELQTRYFEDDLDDYNVLAEIPGGDPALRDELVMLGAHFDSWHTGTGTTDNGCGSAVVMEAARLIAAYCRHAQVQPRRTIRAALWSGEEQGLLGSRAYVKEHFGDRDAPTAAQAKVSGYFNLDNGTGRIRGVYLQGNEGVRPIFASWLAPFADLDATTLTGNDTGGTDHLAFDRVGIPGFQFIQDPVSYSTRTHHSNMDVWDHAEPGDLRQAAVIMAAFVWHTAQRDGMLPRKPAAESDGDR
ncbi:MAG: M28 family peptidase [Planctomycetota bacterium]